MRETMLIPSMKILNLEWPLVPGQIDQHFLRQYSQLQFLMDQTLLQLHAIPFLNPSLLTGLSHHHSARIKVIDEMSVKSAIYNALTEICLKLKANTVSTVHGFDFLHNFNSPIQSQLMLGCRLT